MRDILSTGHELGGHTAHHLDQSTLVRESTNEVRRQICWDRNELTGILIDPSNPQFGTYSLWDLAYPFGTYSAPGQLTTVRNIAGELSTECGQYLSARATGGVADTSACTDSDPTTMCDVAEVLPIAASYRYRIRSPSSIKCKTGLAQIKGWITSAVAATCPGPGTEQWWVIPVFHHIRALASKCSALNNPEDFGILDSEFVSLVAWLRANSSQLEFKTMHAALDPGVAEKSIVLPPYIATRTSVANAGMTDDLPSPGDGLADRYQVSGAITASRGQESGSGNWYSRLEMSASADATFLTRRDMNTSALRVTAPGAGIAQYYQVSLRHRLHPAGLGALSAGPAYTPDPDEDDVQSILNPEGGAGGGSGFAAAAAPQSATDPLALLIGIRAPFLQAGGPSGALPGDTGSPDGREDAFWSSSFAYTPGGACTTATFAPAASWQTVTAIVKINGDGIVRKRPDAMSLGLSRNSKTGAVDLDVDDFAFCACGGAVDSVPACAPACTLPTGTCL